MWLSEKLEIEISLSGPPALIGSLSKPLKKYAAGLPLAVSSAINNCGLKFLARGEAAAINHFLEKIATTIDDIAPTTGTINIHVRDCQSSEQPLAKTAFSPVAGLVVEPWMPGAVASQEGKTIFLAANEAFGVGTHPTTRLCLAFLAELSKEKETRLMPNTTVLDIGCGSGILTMAAVKFGAANALGVEIDQDSAEIAKQNVLYNRMGDQVEIRTGSLEKIAGQFDLVLANLVIAILLPMADDIAASMHPGGLAVLSGFSAKKNQSVIEKFAKIGLSFIEMKNADNWGALLLKKKSTSSIIILDDPSKTNYAPQ